jgi:hypothetical protein
MADREIMQGMLRQVVGLMHMISIEDMEAYIEGISENNNMYDAVGPMLDPTEYRKTLHSGKRDNMRVELQIVKKMLDIRKLINTLTPIDSDEG